MRVSAMGKATCMMVLAVLVLSAGRVSALDPEDVSTWFTTGPVCYQLPVFSANNRPVHVRERGRQRPVGAPLPRGAGGRSGR
jgi:hypothetical protein